MPNDKENPETKPLNNNNNGNGKSAQSKPKIQPKYSIHRDVLTHELVIKDTGYAARDKSIPSSLRNCWRGWNFLSLFTGVIPILQWLPQYSLRRDLIGDIIAGFTVAIMNIPHGMAYGMLAGVSAGNGLYMAVFPVLVYMLLGTSKHISIGTFAVASMMTQKVVLTYANFDPNAAIVTATTTTASPLTSLATSTAESLSLLSTTTATTTTTTTTAAAALLLQNATTTMLPENIITNLEVVTSLALAVGIVNLLMSFFRLGTLASLLSEPLVNGFTTAAACHVVTAQLKDVLGIAVPRHKGAFKILYTVIDVVKGVPDTNLVNFGFCMGVIIFMTICNECLKPFLSKRCRFPLPGELIAVIGGTLISKFCHLKADFNLQPVGVIPKGLPDFQLPRLDLVPLVAVDSIAIAIVTYSIIMSMGLTFAKKHGYEVRANQELFAMGVGNIVGGCFSCLPMACSLSRSVIQDQTGGVSQIASLVSASLVVATIMWIGPFFSDLPRCVLAGVIIVALKPMFMQVKELKKFSKQGKLEMFTWIFTFLCVVLIDIDIGLLIGVCVSLLALYIKGLKPYSCLLGYMPEAPGIYMDMNQHRNVMQVPETRIFRYCGSLNFATSLFFRRALNETVGLDKNSKSSRSPKAKPTYAQVSQNGGNAIKGQFMESADSFQFLILDFTMLGHIDVAGCSTLSDISKELKARGARMLLASPVDRVYDTLVHSMALSEGPFEIFPTLHDAVEYANAFRTA
ncbi:sulfate anion transporter 1 [Drosophila innubila]|uniref:sulfate anion transporter 1 n=1 Tax=Drosophila innubila TaxID=198719 RepID=UPI00148D59EC|nr:sulfate anion transporter 1 [Drosophila innubila]XP_034481694.1 sulfate anion transporter 1 [Drosophila innubila]XP_034481695.1 sulfate anion transporter 1 [Drosophila innubila]